MLHKSSEGTMARSLITGKHKVRAQNVSHSNIKTKRWQRINVQRRRLWVPELGRFVRITLTTRDLRSIDKLGFMEFVSKSVNRRLNQNVTVDEITDLFSKLGIQFVFEDGCEGECENCDCGHKHAHADDKASVN
jgi:large subunit ribosomal protein L28